LTIELTRDEAEELLKILKLMYTNHALTKALADRLAGEPLIEFPKKINSDCPYGLFDVCCNNFNNCNLDDSKERKWKDLSTAEIKAIWNLTKKPSEFSTMLLAKIKERNYEH
jgi:hypothetical protein